MPKSIDRDDMYYIVCSDVNQGKQFAYVLDVQENANLTDIMKEHPNMASSIMCTDRTRAYDIMENFNGIFQENGTFGYQDPDSSIWYVYDLEKGEMLQGEEALIKVMDDVVRSVHGEPDIINPSQIDISDSNIVQAGYWGPNRSVQWAVTNDGTLYLNGTDIRGDGHTPPWSAYHINKCVIHCDTIGDCAFMGDRINAPELEVHCKSIGSGAFSHNHVLKHIDIHADFIADSAFSGCDNIESAKIHCDKQMQPFAMADCPALEYVNITGDIDTIQDGTFNGCQNLKCVTIEGNTQLSNYALPQGVQTKVKNERAIGDESKAVKNTNVRQRTGEHEQAKQKKEEEMER